MILFILTFLLIPSISEAITVSYLNAGYTSTEFLTLNYFTISSAFDKDGNLYTSPNIFSNTISILKYDAATGYSTSSVYASYFSYGGVTGLDFGNNGNLFVSEATTLENGLIREIDSTTKSVVNYISLPDYRPTGIDAVSSENIYFNGRLGSNPYFGNIYKSDSEGNIENVFGGFVGTGIALDSFGNIYSSTSYSNESAPYMDASIYMLDSVDLTPSLFATFDQYTEELTFDNDGNLYALFPNLYNYSSTTIMKISSQPVPEPTTLLLLSSGFIGLAGISRKRKNRMDGKS